MPDNALITAHNPDAPQDERVDALSVAQQSAMPSHVAEMMPLVEFMVQQQQEEEFAKSLRKQNVVPFPSKRQEEKTKGMQSVWLDDREIQILGDWYERPTTFSFDLMRQMVDQTPILSAVVMTRIRQVKRFCRVQNGDTGPGFRVKLKNPSSSKLKKEEQHSIDLLQGFITNCGWESNPRQRQRLKRDNFSGFMSKFIRDSLVLDSAPIETEFKRDRSRGLDGFYAVDGATIRLCSEDGYRGDDEIFALQVIQGNIRAAYTYDDLIYVPRNPRTDVNNGGYGMSEIELLVRVVTGFLNAMTYNHKYFDSNAIPKGLLHLSGSYSQDDLSSFKRYWNSMVRGINNAWTLPVMVSKVQESIASFEKFGVVANEIMFAKWMTFLTSIICAIYGIAPDEINFESFTAGTSSLSGSDTEEKLINSKDKGLRPLLAHCEDIISEYIMPEFGDKYTFDFTGLDEKTPSQEWTEELATSTFDEMRKRRNKQPIGGLLGSAPANQALIQVYMQEHQPAPPQGGPDGAPGEGQPDAGGPDEQPAGDNQDDDYNDLLTQLGRNTAPEDKEKSAAMMKSLGFPIWDLT